MIKDCRITTGAYIHKKRETIEHHMIHQRCYRISSWYVGCHEIFQCNQKPLQSDNGNLGDTLTPCNYVGKIFLVPA